MTNLVAVAEGAGPLDVLAQRYRAAFEKTKAGREQWIEGTLELAAVIREARELIPDHREYSHWLTRNQLEQFHPNKLRAYVGLGVMHRKDPAAANKLLEDNFGLEVRTIWEKQPKSTPTRLGKGPISHKSGAYKRKRAARIPTVMQEANPPPAPKTWLKDRFLTPEQVDPDFKGTDLEFTTAYGHVPIHTKAQLADNKRQDALTAFLGTVADLDRTARAMLAALAGVDPATLKEWVSKPAKAEKWRVWCNTLRDAVEAIETQRS
jgi:hypothetical protein